MSEPAESHGVTCIVVIPEGARSTDCRIGERTETLASLRRRLLSYFAPELEVATPAAVRLALAGVAPEIVEADAWLAAIARRGGRAWLRVLDGLCDAIDVVGDRLDALGIVARGDDSIASRAGLLLRLSFVTDRTLERAGFLHPAREAERVAALVARADAAAVVDALSAVSLRACGIVDWSVPDVRLWRVLDASLSRAGGRTSIELPVLDRPLDAERQRDPLDALIEAIASALDDAPLTTPIAPSLGDLRLDSASTDAGVARVEVCSATSADAQGRAIAEAVYASLQQGGSLDDAVVALVSDDESSAFEIIRALRDAGIAAVDARRVRARRSNVTALANDALDVAERGSSRKDVALLLRSPYVDLGPHASDDATNRRALCLLARTLEETVTGRGEDSVERLRATIESSSAWRGRDARALTATVERLARSLASVAEASTRGELVRAARALWADLGLERACGPSEALAADDVERLDVDARARGRDREAWSALHATLTEYESVLSRLGMAGAPSTLQTFRHELEWVVARRPFPAALVLDAVRLVRFADLAAENAALVVIADADSDAWPEGRARAQLVPAPLDERLKDASDPSFVALAHAGSDQVLARLALGTSRAKRVVFTYRARDDEDGAKSPAAVVARLSRVSGVVTTVWRSSAAIARPLSEHDWTLTELARSPGLAADLVPHVARRVELENARSASFGSLVSEGHALFSTLPNGRRFGTVLAEETGGGDRPLSASAVDRLASCVFQGFVTEVLRPKRSREVFDIADSRQAGETAHAALDAAFNATSKLWSVRPRDESAITRIGIQAAERALMNEGSASELSRTVRDQALSGVRAVLSWSLADESWDFAHTEQAFGDQETEGGWKTLVIENGDVRVALRGRIDRVDVGHLTGAVRVIDYKPKESAARAYTAAFGETKFQLALYSRVAETALGRSRGEGLYLQTQRLRTGMSSKKHSERWALAHEVVDGVPRFEQRVIDLVRTVREGRVGVQPYAPASCEHCDYDGVCRKPRFAVSMTAADGADEEDS